MNGEREKGKAGRRAWGVGGRRGGAPQRTGFLCSVPPQCLPALLLGRPSQRADPQHRHLGTHRLGEDHADRACPLLHRQDRTDARGGRRWDPWASSSVRKGSLTVGWRGLLCRYKNPPVCFHAALEGWAGDAQRSLPSPSSVLVSLVNMLQEV